MQAEVLVNYETLIAILLTLLLWGFGAINYCKGGGAFSTHPYKNLFRDQFDPIFWHKKFEKVIKTIENVPKTVDNHQEQLVFGQG